jgi:hypothetical protein
MPQSFPSTAPKKLQDEDRKPEPGLVFDEAFIEHRQPAQSLLKSRGLAQAPPPAVRHQFTW